MQLPCVYMNPLPPAMNPQTPAVSAIPCDHLSHLPALRPSEHPGPPHGPHRLPPPLHLPVAPSYVAQQGIVVFTKCVLIFSSELTKNFIIS